MKLSVITINRNNLDGLRQTVDSVLGQSASRTSFEYIVVDGASSDGSAAYLESRGQELDKWVSERDGGIYAAMNKGVSFAQGDYCLFLNSGDVLHDDKVLEDILQILSGEDLIIGKMRYMDTGACMQTDENISLFSLYEGSLPHSATFISRLLLQKFPYDERLRIVSDWKFWIQAIVLNGASYRFTDRIISDFDCNGISATNRTQTKLERQAVLRELIPDRILCDYRSFISGKGYQASAYDLFYISIRDTRYGKWLFSLNKRVLKIAALIFPSARFVRTLPEE